MNIGKKNDKEFLNIAFADSYFEQNHLKGGLDIYALASTKESLSTMQFIRAQDAFGIGDFEIEIDISGEDVSFCKTTNDITCRRKLSITKFKYQT